MRKQLQVKNDMIRKKLSNQNYNQLLRKPVRFKGRIVAIKFAYMPSSIVLLIAFVCIITSALIINPLYQVYADSLKNALKQRIGNYEVEMITDPKSPLIGQNNRISLRFGSVNGDDLIDVPIVIRIFKDNIELEKTDQILVPYGHYNYDYVFPESGRYILYVDVNDVAYSNQILNFIYFIDVPESWNNSSMPLAILTVIVITIVITTIVSVIFFQRKKKQQSITNTKN